MKEIGVGKNFHVVESCSLKQFELGLIYLK